VLLEALVRLMPSAVSVLEAFRGRLVISKEQIHDLYASLLLQVGSCSKPSDVPACCRTIAEATGWPVPRNVVNASIELWLYRQVLELKLSKESLVQKAKALVHVFRRCAHFRFDPNAASAAATRFDLPEVASILYHPLSPAFSVDWW